MLSAVSDTSLTLPVAVATRLSPESSAPSVTVTRLLLCAFPSYVHDSLAALIVIAACAFVIVSSPFT